MLNSKFFIGFGIRKVENLVRASIVVILMMNLVNWSIDRKVSLSYSLGCWYAIVLYLDVDTMWCVMKDMRWDYEPVTHVIPELVCW